MEKDRHGNKESKIEFQTQFLKGGEGTWMDYHKKFNHILKSSLADLDDGAITTALIILRADLLSQGTNFYLLKSGEEIVGFTSTKPAPASISKTNHVLEREIIEMGMTHEKFEEIQKDTVQFGWTAIAPEYRHKGGWSLLMDEAEARIQDDPANYKYMIRYVRKANDYSNKLAQRYAGRILYSDTYLDRFFGVQDYYRIALPKK